MALLMIFVVASNARHASALGKPDFDAITSINSDLLMTFSHLKTRVKV
jgi:hypothetical protein